jgi:hypothetical protein
VRNQVSNPYATMGKIIVLKELIGVALSSKEDSKTFWTEQQQNFTSS